METVGGEPRLRTLDTVRGFAVCGILVMNIVAMGMPAYAYVDPYYYGGTRPADLIAWGAAYLLADGKLRALFTMLFGASMALVADRAEVRDGGPVATHYRRMAVLLLFGMAHAWLIWFGDILVLYAVAGSIAFAAWKWPPSALAFAAIVLLAIVFALDLLRWHDLAALRDAASAPHAPAAARATWGEIARAGSPADPAIAEQLRLYRGGFGEVFAARAATTWLYQSVVLPDTLPETLGLMALGLLLHRAGYLAGHAWARTYALLLAIGYGPALALTIWTARLLLAARFDPVTVALAAALEDIARPWIALAHAAAIILLVRSGRLPRLVARLAAAGRMAFSNYLGTSLVTTTIFYGYGFGLYGRLGRAELYGVVLLVWGLILGWSAPWLARFHYGPLEWAWRSLARGRLQPFRQKSSIETYSQ